MAYVNKIKLSILRKQVLKRQPETFAKPHLGAFLRDMLLQRLKIF